MTASTDASQLFRAFADPSRLRILNLLLEHELCVCDLVEVLNEIQPKVSRHLAILRRAGLVSARVDGKWRFYSLVDPQRPGLQRTLLECVRCCLSDVPDLAADRARLRGIRTTARCA